MNARQKAKKYKKQIIDMYERCNIRRPQIDCVNYDILTVGASITVHNEYLERPGVENRVRENLMYALTETEEFKHLVEFESVPMYSTYQTTIHAKLRGIKSNLDLEED